MAAKKASAKKAAPAKKGKDSFSGVKAKTPVNKKSQAGDLGEERTVMRQAARSNRQSRKDTESLPTGLVTVSYRDKSGKLKNTTVSRAFGASMPSSNYVFFNKKKK
jgi:hypothetical protein